MYCVEHNSQVRGESACIRISIRTILKNLQKFLAMPPAKKSSRAQPRHNPPIGPTALMNNLYFVLNIKTSNTAPQRGMLMNRFEQPDSVIQGISHTPITKYNSSRQEHEELSANELKEPGFYGDTMTMKSVWKDDSGAVVAKTKKTFKNTKGFFTIKQVAANIVKFEIKDRPKTKWFGGIDAHHVFFEGLRPNSRGDTYSVFWGS